MGKPRKKKEETLAEILTRIMAAQDPPLKDLDVAEAAGVTYMAVYYWRTGQRRGSQGSVLKLWRYLRTLDSDLRLEDLLSEGVTR